MMKVKNPTSKGKAVRHAGGLEVITSGKTRTFENVDWSEEDVARYEAAGLVLTEVKSKASEKKAD